MGKKNKRKLKKRKNTTAERVWNWDKKCARSINVAMEALIRIRHDKMPM
jgi:hypothetical protein